MSIFGGSRLGIASSYGLSSDDIAYAYDRGARFFFWGALRRPSFARGVRRLSGSKRAELTLGLQSYARMPALVGRGVESGLRGLGVDHADLLVLAWWTDVPLAPIVEAALGLKERGVVRHVMVSSHRRPTLARLGQDPRIDGLMVRYNAAHPGAETELFPHLTCAPGRARRPSILAFNATRWASLIGPARASDCYRFALSHPSVDACLCGPSNRAELTEALDAVEQGPLDEEELAFMRAHGADVRARLGGRGGLSASVIGMADEVVRRWSRPTPHLLVAKD